MKLHAHCVREGEFFGREQDFKDSANNPACPDRPPNDGYVQALALGACRLLRIGRGSRALIQYSR